MDHPEELPADIRDSLSRLGLVPAIARVEAERLTGGVSSDIWKVAGFGRVFCVKRAMAKLAVKDDWFAPVERNRYERRWYEVAGARVAGLAPEVIAVDDDAMLFVMEYLDPADHQLWKSELMAGRVDLGFAGEVGASLAAIHAATADDDAVAAMFPTGELFEALRLEPYLRATARRHEALAGRLNALADRTAATRRALVHGDVSPKNIMIGPSGPVLLDAECAWFGDPAFDLAFCLNHLLLKCLHVPAVTGEFLMAFDRLAGAYLRGVTWEPPADLEARVAALLPGLFLARVDGKSPVEYVSGEAAKNCVRRVAIPFIESPPPMLETIRAAWADEMSR